MRRRRWQTSLFAAAVAYLASCIGVARCADGGDRPLTRHKTIVVLIDGFANWLLYEDDLKDYVRPFDQIFARGARADYLLPEFPTVGPTNFFSMFTGQKPSEHGIYDEILHVGKTFHKLDDMDTYDAIVPNGTDFVWDIAMREGVRTAFYYWKVCTQPAGASNLGCLPAKRRGLVDEAELSASLADMIEQLTQRDAGLVFVNYAGLARTARANGLHSGSARHALGVVASHMHQLQKALTTFGLWDDVNLIVVSDHGLAATSHDRFIFLDDHLDVELTERVVLAGSHAWIHADEHNVYKIQQQLHGKVPYCRVHMPADFPPRWRLSKEEAVRLDLGQLLLLCDPGHGVACRTPCHSYPPLPKHMTNGYFPRALAGYDNAVPQMKAVFLARGPDITSGVGVTVAGSAATGGGAGRSPVWLRATDVHTVLCHVLKLRPCMAAAGGRGTRTNYNGDKAGGGDERDALLRVAALVNRAPGAHADSVLRTVHLCSIALATVAASRCLLLPC